jgi:hypothetical protein
VGALARAHPGRLHAGSATGDDVHLEDVALVFPPAVVPPVSLGVSGLVDAGTDALVLVPFGDDPAGQVDQVARASREVMPLVGR